MIYTFKPGSHLKGDAQPVGERLDALRKKKTGLTPAAVVADAKRPDSALHPFFEWDDSKAATKYRLEQAGHLIRCVTVTMDEPTQERVPTTFRAFLPVDRKADGESVFESTAEALSDADYRRQILGRAYSELGAVARKYRELKELTEVVTAIDRVGELLTERLPEAG